MNKFLRLELSLKSRLGIFGIEKYKRPPLPASSRALNDLEERLSDFLNYRNGYFVELGANNGINQSNTIRLERDLGWRGLLIEPIPWLAKGAMWNRPNCIIENCACVPSNYPETHIMIHYADLMSMVKGGMQTASEENEHLDRALKVQPDLEKTTLVRVKARTLTEVLRRAKAPRSFDFLSLDVEGYEAQVLDGLDFDAFLPKYMLIEVRYPEAVEHALRNRYEVIAKLSHHDVLYGLR
jgi:FkbM family methyltransferase